jgi:hypothetical protein
MRSFLRWLSERKWQATAYAIMADRRERRRALAMSESGRAQLWREIFPNGPEWVGPYVPHTMREMIAGQRLPDSER